MHLIAFVLGVRIGFGRIEAFLGRGWRVLLLPTEFPPPVRKISLPETFPSSPTPDCGTRQHPCAAAATSSVPAPPTTLRASGQLATQRAPSSAANGSRVRCQRAPGPLATDPRSAARSEQLCCRRYGSTSGPTADVQSSCVVGGMDRDFLCALSPR